MSGPGLRCGDYVGHQWRWGGWCGAFGNNTNAYDVQRFYYCERCGCMANAVAIFKNNIRAERIARDYKIGRYAAMEEA